MFAFIHYLYTPKLLLQLPHEAFVVGFQYHQAGSVCTTSPFQNPSTIVLCMTRFRWFATNFFILADQLPPLLYIHVHYNIHDNHHNNQSNFIGIFNYFIRVNRTQKSKQNKTSDIHNKQYNIRHTQQAKQSNIRPGPSLEGGVGERV